MKRIKKMAGWGILALLALIFLQSGVQNLIGTEPMITALEELGYPRWSHIVIGVVEAAGGLALLNRKTRRYSSIGLTVLMIGAVGSHLMHGQWSEALMPLGLLAMMAVIAAKAGLSLGSEK